MFKNGFLYEDAKEYKGYIIVKSFKVDHSGKKMLDSLVFMVNDFQFNTIPEAESYIDSLNK